MMAEVTAVFTGGSLNGTTREVDDSLKEVWSYLRVDETREFDEDDYYSDSIKVITQVYRLTMRFKDKAIFKLKERSNA